MGNVAFAVVHAVRVIGTVLSIEQAVVDQDVSVVCFRSREHFHLSDQGPML